MGSASAVEPPESSTTIPSPTQAMSSQTSSETISLRIALPDDGPRYDRTMEGPEFLQFQDAVEAFTRGQYAAARGGFEALARLDQANVLVPPSKVFLAELTLLEDPTDHGRREAITQYRSVINVYQENPNTSRALWRVGDLYAEMGWFQESIVAYEYALSRGIPRHDADRSMLGLGVTLGEVGRWTEAERVFDTVRKRATDDRLVARATFDLADVLYAQQRKKDALPVYDLLYHRWPALIKKDPDALHQYGDVLLAAQELRRACEVDLLLYNLFPSHRHAGTALISLGDIHSGLGLRTPAELFYTTAETQYAETAAGVVARMRLSRIEQELSVSAGDDFLRKKVEGMIRGGGDSYLESSEGETLYKGIALEHQDDILGSEALFRLAEHYELHGDLSRAIQVYQEVTRRTGVTPRGPWPLAAGVRLTSILRPQLETALKSKNDVQVLTLFHSHGQAPEQHYDGTHLLLEVADTHRRMGFSSEAVHLYQTLMRNRKAAPLHEETLMGLGESYLDQLDPAAARNVFESFRLQYPQSARSARASQQLARAMLEQGDRQSAIRVMRQWLRRHPRDSAAGWMHVKLARTLMEERKPEEAGAVFDEALHNHILLAPQDLLLFADLLTAMKRPQRAVELYRQVLTARPEPAQAEWARVQIMQNLGTKQPVVPSLTRSSPGAESYDSLLHRAAAAMQTGLRATLQKEGE